MIGINEWVLISVLTGQPLASPVNCGWECGLRVDRDTTTQSGGAFQTTQHPLMVWNRIGANILNREFSSVFFTESFQNSGEGVSVYAKTEKRGKAPAWGGVSEIRDWENKEGASVAHEFDIFTTGPATDPDNGLSSNGGRVRVGVDVVVGDESFKNGGPKSAATGSMGINVYATSNTPWAKWIYGAKIADYRRSGVRLTGIPGEDGWIPERAIDLQGNHIVGIDFSQGNFQSVIRLKEGQAYSFDEFDNRNLAYKNGKLEFSHVVLVNGKYVRKNVMVLDYATGELRVKKVTLTPNP